MNYKSRPFAALVATAAVLACSAFPAAAQNYWMLKAVPSLKPTGSGGGQTPPSINLAAAVLPDGMEGKPYSFDLKTVSSIGGGPGIGAAQYVVTSGTLPAGVSLSNNGQLVGTPSGPTVAAGVDFTVEGSYVTATSQRGYTVKILEASIQAVKIGVGSNWSCAVTVDGRVACWGQGYGNTPVAIGGLVGVVDLALGPYHGCALTESGAVRCWGSNDVGQLGDGSYESSPLVAVTVQGLSNGVSGLSAGMSTSCAVASGSLYCWGGDYGQIATKVSSVSDVVKQFSMKTGTKCYVTTGGAAKCWGVNTYGQLGVGYQSGGDPVTVPLQVVGLSSGVDQISVGAQHVCATMANGTVYCWGRNGAGQLGNGTAVDASAPALVAGLPGPVRKVEVGANHTCAATAGGAALCWGSSTLRQLGNGGTTASSVPVQVSGLQSGVSTISTYNNHTCAVGGAATARCWGSGTFGQLGNGSTSSQASPVAVKPLP